VVLQGAQNLQIVVSADDFPQVGTVEKRHVVAIYDIETVLQQRDLITLLDDASRLVRRYRAA